MMDVRQVMKFPIKGFFLRLVEIIKSAFTQKKDVDKYIRTTHIYYAYTQIIGCPEEDYFSKETLEGFYGFIDTEFDLSRATAESYFRNACQLPRFIDQPEYKYHLGMSDEYREHTFWLYTACKKDRSLLTYYEAWPLRSKDGRQIYLNMVQFQIQYGKTHTNHWYRQLVKYARTLTGVTLNSEITSLHVIFDLLYVIYPDGEYLEILSDPLEVNEAFEEMYEISYVDYLKNTPSPSSTAFQRSWSITKRVFQAAIIGRGLVAESLYDLYAGDSRDSLTGKLKADSEKLVSLLTPLPLHLSDNKVAELVFRKITSDYETLKDCCEVERRRTMEGFNNRIEASKIGTISNSVHSTAHRRLYINRCATWQHHGYTLDSESSDYKNIRRQLFGIDSSLNIELMLLTTRLLLPFIYLLIMEHPFITPGWLLNFAIYDKHGKLSNFLNEGRVVISFKNRRGIVHAQQECHLTPKSKAIFEDIIAITAQARQFLKDAGDDQYRFLLIGSNGVSRPYRVTNLPQLFNNARDEFFVKMLIDRLGIDVAKRINPKSIRSTAGVKVYIDTGRIRAMSEALGHLTFSLKLIESYLPKELRLFFFNRWIRIFQTAITYEAVRGRPCMDEVMGAKTMADIDEFFENHGLKPLPPYLEMGTHGLPVEQDDSVQMTHIVIPITPQLCDVLVTMGQVIRDLDHQNTELSKEAATWKQTIAFVERTVAMHKEHQLRTCSADVIKIFESAKVVPSMARKLTQLMTFNQF
jgi:hypothetical protein